MKQKHLVIILDNRKCMIRNEHPFTLYDINFIANIYLFIMTRFYFYLIGTYSQDDVNNLLVESIKMKLLNYLNVMRIEGVSLDVGPVSFIVLPYMAGIYM